MNRSTLVLKTLKDCIKCSKQEIMETQIEIIHVVLCFLCLPGFISSHLSSPYELFKRHPFGAARDDAKELRALFKNDPYTDDGYIQDTKNRNNLYKTLSGIPYTASRIQQYTESRIDPFSSFKVKLYTTPGTDPHTTYIINPDTSSTMDTYATPKLDNNAASEMKLYTNTPLDPYTAYRSDPDTSSTTDTYATSKPDNHATSETNPYTNSPIDPYTAARIDLDSISTLDTYTTSKRNKYATSGINLYTNSPINPYTTYRSDPDTTSTMDTYLTSKLDNYATSYTNSLIDPDTASTLGTHITPELDTYDKYAASKINPYTIFRADSSTAGGSDPYTMSRIMAYKPAIFLPRVVYRTNGYKGTRKPPNHNSSTMAQYNNYMTTDGYSNRLKRGGSTQRIHPDINKRLSPFNRYYRYNILSRQLYRPSRQRVRTRYGYVYMYYFNGQGPLDTLASKLLGRK